MNLEEMNCIFCDAPLSVALVMDENGDKYCKYCGHKIEEICEDDSLSKDIQEAVELRNKGAFKKAAERFRLLLKNNPDNVIIRWQLLLCKYGVVYAERKYYDEVVERKITCWEKVDSNILSETEYFKIINLASGNERKQYVDDANTIAQIQRKINNASNVDYDIFICYKETNKDGKRTMDSFFAEKIYVDLKLENYKVFFARETLKNKAGSDYEAAIFNAVSSAKIMIAVGSKKEYLESTWVQNEWSRFLYAMSQNRKKRLIPIYKSSPYYLPKRFKDEHLQGIEMDNISSLKENIHQIIPKLAQEEFVKNDSAFEKVIEGEYYVSIGDTEKAFESFHYAALKGNTEACYYLGVELYTKEESDFREAFKWFEKAAQGGLVQAQEQVAFMYEYGIGVEKNQSIANQWKFALEQNKKEVVNNGFFESY